MRICFLELHEIVNRLLRSGWDQEVHKAIITHSQLKAFEFKAQVKEYEGARNREKKVELLQTDRLQRLPIQVRYSFLVPGPYTRIVDPLNEFFGVIIL